MCQGRAFAEPEALVLAQSGAADRAGPLDGDPRDRSGPVIGGLNPPAGAIASLDALVAELRIEESRSYGHRLSAASFAGLLVWSAALIGLGRVEPGPEVMPAWAGIGEAAGLGLAYLVWGGVWGWAGWLGAQLLRWLTRRPAK